jgi:hypothetical protein
MTSVIEWLKEEKNELASVDFKNLLS